jgi:hypothetical protein
MSSPFFECCYDIRTLSLGREETADFRLLIALTFNEAIWHESRYHMLHQHKNSAGRLPYRFMVTKSKKILAIVLSVFLGITVTYMGIRDLRTRSFFLNEGSAPRPK